MDLSKTTIPGTTGPAAICTKRGCVLEAEYGEVTETVVVDVGSVYGYLVPPLLPALVLVGKIAPFGVGATTTRA